MSKIATLHGNLKTIVASTTSFTELTHILNIEKNKFTQGGRFGVIPRGAREAQGVTKAVTQDLIFSIVLTDTFISQSISDSGIMTKVISLMDAFENIYRECSNTKILATDIVLLVSTFDISEAIILETEKTIIVEGNLTIRVKNTL